MKRINIILGLIAGTALLASCTGQFETWNVNPNDATKEDLEHDNLNTGAYFAQMQRGVFIIGKDLAGKYQQTQACEGDLFSGYLATIMSWTYTAYNHDHYFLYPEWYNAPFNEAYERVMQPWKMIADITDEGSPARAMATVIKVFGMHRITDMYGPIPYSRFGTAINVEYDSQKDVYERFFQELETSIQVLSEYADNNSASYLADYDNVYSGNVQKWIKFANTLRLRLAMRVSNVDPELAKAQAEKAVTQKYGLMSTSDDDASVHQNSTLTFLHPLWEIGTSFDDEHMGATMECYLSGYKDPRLSRYFLAAESTGEYKGVRNGLPNVQKAKYQKVSSRPNFSQTSDMHWMYAAEAWLLKAEAKLRFDLGSESVKECYEQGIRSSMSSAGVPDNEISAYIANAENLPLSSFQDPSDGRSSDVSKMLSFLPVAWDDTVTDDKKLERIMIQKWIALYPDGQEAWSEMRRTGYPGWVRISSYSYQSEVKDGEMISRLKFPTTEYTNNTANTQAAVAMLGGRDAAGTRLWWDVKR